MFIKERVAAGDVEILMTRDKDITMLLSERTLVANKADADMYVSVHCNAAENRDATGIEIYNYYGSKKGAEMANRLLNSWVKYFPMVKNRGVKESGFYVLTKTVMPAVLIEMDFISNLQVESMFGTESFENSAGSAIIDGIMSYKRSIE